MIGSRDQLLPMLCAIPGHELPGEPRLQVGRTCSRSQAFRSARSRTVPDPWPARPPWPRRPVPLIFGLAGDQDHQRALLKRVLGRPLERPRLRRSCRPCRSVAPRHGPCMVGGNVNGIGSQWPFKSISKVSPTIGSPRSVSSLIRSPARRIPRHLTNPAFQSPSDISSPEGVKNEISLTFEPRMARPMKNLRR